jgi:pullulanase/glycogen debranching enzyme
MVLKLNERNQIMKLIAIIDNGSSKRGTCDDCGAALRYEYHTSDGGRYGSECVHRHIHALDWVTFNAARDAREFNRRLAGFRRMYPIARKNSQITYHEYRDGSIGAVNIARYGEAGQEMLVTTLLAEGWAKEIILNMGRLMKYLLRAN